MMNPVTNAGARQNVAKRITRRLIAPLPIGLMATALVLAAPALAGEAYTLTLKDHVFVQETLTVPAGVEFSLIVVNQDSGAEEFESHDLHIEKIVTGGKSITLAIGPLDPGTYNFVGEFHEDSAHGTLIVGDAK